jgi:hypothetical protein
MIRRDKLELGLKVDAAYRKDNLTPGEIRGPEIPMGPGRSPQIPMAQDDETEFRAGAAKARRREAEGRRRRRSSRPGDDRRMPAITGRRSRGREQRQAAQDPDGSLRHRLSPMVSRWRVEGLPAAQGRDRIIPTITLTDRHIAQKSVATDRPRTRSAISRSAGRRRPEPRGRSLPPAADEGCEGGGSSYPTSARRPSPALKAGTRSASRWE